MKYKIEHYFIFSMYENNCEHIFHIKNLLIVNIFREIVRFRLDIDFGGLREKEINSMRLHSNSDILLAFATIFR